MTMLPRPAYRTIRTPPPLKPCHPLGGIPVLVVGVPEISKKDSVMLRSSITIAVTAGLMLSACATSGSGSSPAGTASLTALQGGEWRVEDIAGAGVIDNSPATLLFGADGRLSGNASCNRLIASYTIEGSKLTISPAGTTMMACPPALMDQERKLVDLLGTVTRYSIDRTGALTLTSASGKQIVARR